MEQFGTPEDVQTNRDYICDLRASAAEASRMVDQKQAAAAAGVPDDTRQARARTPRRVLLAVAPAPGARSTARAIYG
jgi:hypothetical protein